MSTEVSYPNRQPFFAYRYTRLLAKTCAAQEIGHVAFTLCVTIAHIEDAKRYKGPVTYYNEQLMPIMGITQWESLDRARKKAEKHGWLHYEPGKRGGHSPGRYWVTIPPGLEDIDDTPCDESSNPKLYFSSTERTNPEDDAPQSICLPGSRLNQEPKAVVCLENHYPDQEPDREPDHDPDQELSILSLNPNPDPKELLPSNDGDHAEAAIDDDLLNLIEGWNSLSPSIVTHQAKLPPSQAILKGWARAKRDPELREVVNDTATIIEAIRNAKFCHGQPWFSIPWLFGKNQAGEKKLLNLLAGGYTQQQEKQKRSTHGRREFDTGLGRIDPKDAGRCSREGEF